MITESNLEEALCKWYVDNAPKEMPWAEWEASGTQPPALLVIEGFEERSLGVLRKLAASRVPLPSLVLARYTENAHLNREYRQEFEALAEQVAPNRWTSVPIGDGSAWVDEAVDRLQASEIMLDISAMTTSGIFCALDQLLQRGVRVLLAYSEAGEYRPTFDEWQTLLSQIQAGVDEAAFIAEMADDMPWLYTGAHHVALVRGHEGYDAAGLNALIAFLPFKCARLAAVLSMQDYSAHVFIAGRPRLETNSWRLDALKRINATVVKDRPVIEMATFGYRDTLAALSTQVCSDRGLLQRFDVHLAPMGSKLQKVACWVLSTLVPAITIITAIPKDYFPQAFSHRVGESWVFPLLDPRKAIAAYRASRRT